MTFAASEIEFLFVEDMAKVFNVSTGWVTVCATTPEMNAQVKCNGGLSSLNRNGDVVVRVFSLSLTNKYRFAASYVPNCDPLNKLARATHTPTPLHNPLTTPSSFAIIENARSVDG